ncbi:hypothetical protein D3C76_1647900 [compost metagenome]
MLGSRAVQLLEHPGLDLLGQEGVGRHDDVIARTPCQQLGFQHLVAVEHVIDDLDARLFLEIFQGIWRDIVAPVVDVQYLVIGHRPSTDHDQRH